MTNMIYSTRHISYTIGYCLNDKMVLDQEGQKLPLYKDRAEILYYNQCFGDKKELISQFKEVAKLNKNALEPYYHISFSIAPQEKLSKSRWVELSLDCARKLEFENNQFITVLHKDINTSHIHIVANRIGFDRRLASDSFKWYKLINLCIDTELRYDLATTLDPRQKLSNEEKQRLRKNIRLDRLKQALGEALKTCCDLPALEEELKNQQIKTYKNEKGISFLLDQRVVFKGFQAGYPWKKIEVILQRNEELKLQQQHELLQRLLLQQHPTQKKQPTPKQNPAEETRIRRRISHHL